MFRVTKRTRRDDTAMLKECRRLAKREKIGWEELAKGAELSPEDAAAFFDAKAVPRVGAITRAAEWLGVETSKFINESPKFYVFFRDHLGVERRVPATTDKRSSMEFGRNVERLVNARIGGGEMPADLLAWADALPPEDAKRLVDVGVVEGSSLSASQPIEEHVKAWLEKIRRSGKTDKHLEESGRMVRALLEAAGARHWPAISLERIEAAFEKLPTKNGEPVSPHRRNKYVTCVKAFARFMVKTRRARVNPLAELDKVRAPKRDRRALSRDEIRWLLETVRTGPVISQKDRRGRLLWENSGEDRHLIYLVELCTGVRATALGALRVRDFKLDAAVPHIHIPAHLEKNRTEHKPPLRPEVAAELRRCFALKTPDARALAVPPPGETAWMIRHDLGVAKAAYAAAGKTKAEQERRRGDDFLAVKVDGYMPFDFHSLRTTAATRLQEDGVPLAFVAKLLNQKSLGVTAGAYTQPGPETLYGLLKAAPALGTGTGPAAT